MLPSKMPHMQTRERTKLPGVYRRGDKYQVTWRDHLGKQRSKMVRTLTEAKTVKAAMETDRLRGELGTASPLTLAEYGNSWLATYTGRTIRGVSKATLNLYGSHMRNHILPGLGKMKLSRMRPTDVKEWAAQLDSRVGRAYASDLLSTLKLILTSAVEEGHLQASPASTVRLPHRPQVDMGDEDEGPDRKALSEEELTTWLNASGEHALFFDFLSETGLRIGEAYGLLWKDFDGKQLRVRRQYSAAGEYTILKSKYSRRTIPLSRSMRVRLAQLKGDLDAPMWPNAFGRPRSRNDGQRQALMRIRTELGMPWVSFHTFRHTCATRLFRANANPKQVQAWMGHHAVTFTLEIYVHLLPSDQIDPAIFDDLRQLRGSGTSVTRRRSA